MLTKFIEAESEAGNWGKFLVGVFDREEWGRRSEILAALGMRKPLLTDVGWGDSHILVLDLQTGEGAIFRLVGHAKNDLDKHAVWVCVLFEKFLEWLYEDWEMYVKCTADPIVVDWVGDKLPTYLKLTGIPLEMAGYRRDGGNKPFIPPDTDTLRMRLLPWVQAHLIQRYSDQSVVSHNEGVEELLDALVGVYRNDTLSVRSGEDLDGQGSD